MTIIGAADTVWQWELGIKQGSNQHNAEVIRSKYKDYGPLMAISRQANGRRLLLQ